MVDKKSKFTSEGAATEIWATELSNSGVLFVFKLHNLTFRISILRDGDNDGNNDSNNDDDDDEGNMNDNDEGNDDDDDGKEFKFCLLDFGDWKLRTFNFPFFRR